MWIRGAKLELITLLSMSITSVMAQFRLYVSNNTPCDVAVVVSDDGATACASAVNLSPVIMVPANTVTPYVIYSLPTPYAGEMFYDVQVFELIPGQSLRSSQHNGCYQFGGVHFPPSFPIVTSCLLGPSSTSFPGICSGCHPMYNLDIMPNYIGGDYLLTIN